MRNIKKIMLTNLRRNKTMLLLALLGALLLCYLFEAGKGVVGYYSASEISIGVIDYDSNVLSDNLCEYISGSLGMSIINNEYDELSDMLLNKDISAIIEIPEGFYENALKENPDKLVITTLDDYENIAFIKAYLDSYMQSVSVLSAAAGGDSSAFNSMLNGIKTEKISVESALVTDRESEQEKAGFQFALGFMCMLMMGLCMFISTTVIEDKQLGTYNRMKISNVKPFEYIAGAALIGILVCCVFSAGLFTYMAIIGAELGIPFGMAVLITFFMILFAVGISIFVALFLNVKSTATTVLVGYTSISCMVGGVYFTIDESIGWIKNFSYLTPQYWFMDIATKYNETNVIASLSILVLFVLLVYLASALIFAKKNA